MLPIISSWVVWVPVSLGLYFSGSTFYAILLASGNLPIHSILILTNIPANSSAMSTSPLPLTAYFIHSDHASITAVHIFLEVYVDVLILSFIPGNAYFVGLSVVMGIYGTTCKSANKEIRADNYCLYQVFGVGGALGGPLLAGFSATVLDIYRDYVSSDFEAGESRRVPSPSISIRQEAVRRSARSKSLFQPG